MNDPQNTQDQESVAEEPVNSFLRQEKKVGWDLVLRLPLEYE